MARVSIQNIVDVGCINMAVMIPEFIKCSAHTWSLVLADFI